MSYRQVLYHIVFGTKDRKNTLPTAQHDLLYRYIWGIIKERNGILYRINGTEDHLHILSDLHPNMPLAKYVSEIKTGRHSWMKNNGNFPQFEGWAIGYAAFTYAYRDKELITNYIINQKEHHRKETFEEELKRLLEEHAVPFEDKFLF